MNILQNINGHQDLIKLTPQERTQLCGEIREFLIENVSKTGGHVSSNLGVVELTVAIETVYDTAKDRLVFDVGHQCYVHKILTGRREAMAGLRQFGGIAGFPKPSESITDSFVAGHASSSVSIALGMARARSLLNEDYDVVTLLGDGAATGGISFEGLNDAAVSREPIVIILNDNTLSIDKNVGGMASHLRQLRTKERYLGMKKKYREFLIKLPGGHGLYTITRKLKDRIRRMLIPTTMFESMGFTYLGPVDGHDTEHLIALLRVAKQMRRPVVLHVLTQKGRGYAPSEEHPKLFHGIGKFDPNSGEPISQKGDTFSDTFGHTMIALAQENERLCAITAAMPGGTGLLQFKQNFPKRLFDVGIAEEHAVSMAAGLSKQGMIPVVALYSTFLQRAYDMILQDISMLKQHVVLCVDRAGLVGEDGETHHGVFDVGFLRHAPGMTILCPGSTKELAGMLRWAVNEQNGPVAIRYPRGGNRGYDECAWDESVGFRENNTMCVHSDGSDVTIITYGVLLNNAMEAAYLLEHQGIRTKVIRLLSVSPIPTMDVIKEIQSKYVFILEECFSNAGIGAPLACAIKNNDSSKLVSCVDLGSDYVTHGSMDKLYRHCGMDAHSLTKMIQEVYQNEN